MEIWRVVEELNALRKYGRFEFPTSRLSLERVIII